MSSEDLSRRPRLPRHAYPFEQRRWTKQDWVMAEKDRDLLAARLELPPVADLSEEVQELLLKYTIACHLNISWYQRQREREQRRYRLFVVLAVAVVAATPALVFFLSTRLDSSQTPLITALLAGIFGTLKCLGAILEHRRLVGLFWKAESDLKTDLYAFEDRWRGKLHVDRSRSNQGQEPGEHDINKDFLLDLKLCVRNAERIRREEQDRFFARFDQVPFDVTQILSSSARAARDAPKTFSSPRKSVIELEAEVAEGRARLAYLSARLEEVSRELASIEGDSTALGDARRQALMDEVDRLHRLRVDLEIALSDRVARLGRNPS